MKGFYRGRKRFTREQPKDAHRINDRITAREVRVISSNGEQLGVMPTTQAARLAEDSNLDLVEVAPNSKPPVCRLMDYGKFKYKEQKKAAEAKKNRSEVTLKELRVRYSTGQGDLDNKLKQAREFLEEGHKVKFSMRFRGREIVNMDLGVEVFDKIVANLEDIASIDDRTRPQGRQISITFAPLKTQPKKGASTNE